MALDALESVYTMNADSLFDRLLNADVLSSERMGDRVVLTESFRSAVETQERAVERSDGLAERLARITNDDEQAVTLEAIAADDPEFVATYLELAQRLPDLQQSSRIRAQVVLIQLTGTPPPDDGAPDCFLPVHGDNLKTLIRLGHPTLVYVWREECPPCETMREELDGLLGDGYDDLARLAVYGPDAATLLHEEYGVVGAPTVLFVAGGHVDARLQGAQYREAIETELTLLREQTVES